jgi:Flp pilus assembly CpaF family ATPase
MSDATAALGYFTRRMQRWLDLARNEPALTEVLYDGDGRTVVDIGGELIPVPDSDLDDKAIITLANNAAVWADDVISRERPYISIIVPPDWRVTFLRSPVVEHPVMAMRKLMRRVIPLSEWVFEEPKSPVAAAIEDLKGLVHPAKPEEWPGEQRERLNWLVDHRKTVAISGGVGTGKTTFLRGLLQLIPLSERIITIEDARELQLTDEDNVSRRRNWVALQAVPKRVGMDELLRTALRLRPDRIIVGEVRGPEALELYRALNVGHDGSMFTLHSNGAQDLLERLHTLVVEAQPNVRFESVARTIDAVVQIEGRGARRRITDIWPVHGARGS